MMFSSVNYFCFVYLLHQIFSLFLYNLYLLETGFKKYIKTKNCVSLRILVIVKTLIF